MDTYHIPGIKDIAKVALPKDKQAEKAAKKVANDIASLVESLFRNWAPSDADAEERSKEGIRKWLAKNSGSKATKSTVNMLYALFKQFRRLTLLDSNTRSRTNRKGADPEKPSDERAMYEPTKAFVSFISECVGAHTKAGKQAKRLILPFDKTDTRPIDSEHDWRVDVALRCASPVDDRHANSITKCPAINNLEGSEDRPDLENTFAYIELKYSHNELASAYAQLCRYSQELYIVQHNRRFIWGMVMCGSAVQACIFGPNCAVSSPTMNFAAIPGRKQLIQLLTHMAFCKERDLGYDPTVSYDYTSRCLKIKACSNKGVEKIFYSREVILCAQRMFGRHTRCFKATPNKPLPLPLDDESGTESYESMGCDTIIKDAWVEAPEEAMEDSRDEVKHMETITADLDGVDTVRDMYPKLSSECSSGRVHLKSPGSEDWYEDTFKTVLGKSVWEQLRKAAKKKSGKDLALRVHKRVFTHGIGSPIKFVESVPELIIVAADVMRCHSEIVSKCSILHRDLSMGNMLVRRDSSGAAHGMIIDFDHAISMGSRDGAPRAERSGTMQFMSCRNLESSQLHPSPLDDWESMLYILCWAGTFGWSTNTSPPDKATGKPLSRRIDGWLNGTSLVNVAKAKRADLNSADNFREITNEFNNQLPDMDLLINLAERLRCVLIDEPPAGLAGALKVTKLQTDEKTRVSKWVVSSDPFEKRAPEWKEISANLLKVLEDFAGQARERLETQ
ncbi:hypothetical protein GGI22_004701, partial [Coemansia erecta]